MTKTNAMRLLDKAKVNYIPKEYEYDENDLDGRHAADYLGLDHMQVFKTLVTRGASGAIYVFCIPVAGELNLKKAAAACKEKSIEMIHVKELLPLTGYIRGGCSPIGMKKKYPTFIDETATLFDFIAVSAGMRGLQLTLSPDDLCSYIDAKICDLTA